MAANATTENPSLSLQQWRHGGAQIREPLSISLSLASFCCRSVNFGFCFGDLLLGMKISTEKMNQAKSYVRGYGGSGNVKEFYNALPPETKKLVDGMGFKEFIDVLYETSNDHVQLTALAERWCDTTNTLHLSFGEATLTPLNFAAITGIRFGGKLIPYDMKLFKNHSALEYFLGRVPKKISDAGTVKYTWFYECFQNDMKAGPVYATKQEFEQLARSFLLYMFGAALFSNKDSRVHLHYLGAMKDLAAVKDYDWGGALATLYGHMSVASRSKKPSMGGYWQVWEIWSYEFLGMFVPKNNFKDKSVVPRGLKLQKASQGTKKGGKSLETYQAFLDRLQENQAPRDYVEATLVTINGLEMLVRQMVMVMVTTGLELPSTSKKRTVSMRDVPVPQKMSTSTRTRKGKEIATSHGPPVAPTRSSIQTRCGKFASRGRGIAPSSRGKKATVRRRSEIPSPVVSAESNNDEDEDDSDRDESREEDGDDVTTEEEEDEDAKEDTDTNRPSKKAKK